MRGTLSVGFKRCAVALAIVVLAGCGGGKETSTAEIEAEKPAAPQESGEASTPGGSIAERLAREKWTGDLDEIAKRRILRVLVVPGKLGFFFNGSQMQGAIYEFVREFETFLNKKLNTGNLAIHVAFVPVARSRLIPMLAEGRGDLVATLLGASEQREKLVDFSNPLYDNAKGIIISGPGAPPVSRLEDLSGKEVYLYKNTVPFEKLNQLSENFKKEGKAPLTLTPADENLLDDDVLEMVHAGLVPMTVAEDRVAQFWVKVLPRLQLHRDIVVAEGPLAWAVQKNTPKLKALVNEFIETHRVGTAFGNTIGRRYLRDIKWVQDATQRKDLARFEQIVQFFRKYGEKYDVPYLLLAAQGYQESRLNPNLRSPAGAVGVMQIKPTTAASKPIEIRDIRSTDRNIEAGAKYLRYMVDQYYASEPMDRVTKGLFALASYNAGPSRIQKLRKQAAAEGYDPNRWFNNVEIIASKEIGRETVQYVSNIYKYYLAYTMVTEKNARRRNETASGQ
jgi:membrane-bound lytic murein transglycosylase MltF